MKLITRTAAAALLIGLPMTLGACGSSGGSKPSKADVQAGLTKLMKAQAGASVIPDATVKKYTGCIVDKSYDKLSNKALNAITKGDPKTKTDVPQKDKDAYTSAVNSCKSVVMGG